MTTYKFVTRATHAKTGEPLALATDLNNTYQLHTIVFTADEFARYTAWDVPCAGVMVNAGYEVGRNADVDMTAACGRTFHKSLELHAAIESLEADYADKLRSYMCKKCASRTTLSTEPLQQEAVK